MPIPSSSSSPRRKRSEQLRRRPLRPRLRRRRSPLKRRSPEASFPFMTVEPEVLESTIGHLFGNRELLFRALTHKSHAHEQAAPGEDAPNDNEQLEFLGDAILGFLASEALVQHYPNLPEGRLSKLKAHLVSAAHLFEVAQRLELG